MIEVSDAWKDIQRRFLLPESFIEIECAITDVGAQEEASISGTYEAAYSDVESALEAHSTQKFATNELNLWSLDGTCSILPDAVSYEDTGYVSDIASTGSITLSFPEIRVNAISGITITWGNAYGEYPRVFTVAGMNGNTTIAETTVTDNTDRTSVVFLELQNYDKITVVVHDWCLPNRRVRIERATIGHTLTLGKSDILSFKHEQSGDLLSGELPKYSIEFSLDNSDGRWDPNNPTGMERYLTERQKLTVRYGLDVNGSIEWIKAGTFYLSEWNTPSNGLEARFVARDTMDFLLNSDMVGFYMGGNLASIITGASSALLPQDAKIEIDPILESTPFMALDVTDNITAAEIVQKCANAGCCIIRYGRDGVLHVEPLNQTISEYVFPEIGIPLSLSYSYPEITLSKPLKSVAVDYGAVDSEERPITYTLIVSSVGETQSVSNDYIKTEAQAYKVAEWIRDVLKTRKTISGEFRVDPRLEVYDIVTVEDRYGTRIPIAITNITYTYNGAFHGNFTGRVLEV